jgi:hypothetical protein
VRRAQGPSEKIPPVQGIYQLRFNATGEIYVGSSINVGLRFRQHVAELSVYYWGRSDLNRYCSGLNRTVLQMEKRKALENLSYSLDRDKIARQSIASAFELTLLEAVKERGQLLAREQYWFDLLSPTLNKRRPCSGPTRSEVA